MLDPAVTEDILRKFVNDVNASGGIMTDEKGFAVPVADPEWVDIGMTYLEACRHLGIEPKRADGDEEE